MQILLAFGIHDILLPTKLGCWQRANRLTDGHKSTKESYVLAYQLDNGPVRPFCENSTLSLQYTLSSNCAEAHVKISYDEEPLFSRPTANIFNIFEGAFHPQPEGATCRTDRDPPNMLTTKHFRLCLPVCYLKSSIKW
jgi:hypothetical protein